MKIKKLGHTSKFKKDYKKIVKQNKDLKKFEKLVNLLKMSEELPLKYMNHKLVGRYLGYWECHIEPDWLLIYENTVDSLILVRTGSHALLFD